jgi:hypothetical protein
MDEFREYPCVGGPMHGKRLPVRSGQSVIEVPLMRKISDVRFAGSFKAADAEPYERFVYRVQQYDTRNDKGGHDVVWFLVPADLSEIRIFSYILERVLASPSDFQLHQPHKLEMSD